MRNSKWLVVGFLVCLFSSSVSAASKSISDTEIRSVAEPILDRILMAYKTNDYQLYSKDFDVALKNYLTKEIFLKYDADLEGSIGHCQNRQYLGFLRQNENNRAVQPVAQNGPAHRRAGP